MNATFTSRGSQPVLGALLASLTDPVSAIDRTWNLLRTWQGREAARRHLAALDDRLLADVGLSREQAIEEASKPFWRA